jgi:hypothetical protein
MAPQTKKWIIGPLVGASLIGTGLATQKLMEERRKRDLE